MSAYIYIALGSNLEPRQKLPEAVGRLAELVSIKKISPVYRSLPSGYQAQPHFLNAVVQCKTPTPPLELLNQLLALENHLGRIRSAIPANGPRSIDLDLLDYPATTLQHSKLILPHPQLHQRNFVLQPLCDLNPHWQHPTLGQSVLQLLQANQDVPLALDPLELKKP